MLLQSSKPSLYANVDCNALVAAIVGRQTAVVQLLLKVYLLEVEKFFIYQSINTLSSNLLYVGLQDMQMVHLLHIIVLTTVSMV